MWNFATKIRTTVDEIRKLTWLRGFENHCSLIPASLPGDLSALNFHIPLSCWICLLSDSLGYSIPPCSFPCTKEKSKRTCKHRRDCISYFCTSIQVYTPPVNWLDDIHSSIDEVHMTLMWHYELFKCQVQNKGFDIVLPLKRETFHGFL